MLITRTLILFLLLASPAAAQLVDPFPTPIPAGEGVIKVPFVEFASVPDVDGEPPRLMLLVDEPGTRRLFVNAMQGLLYTVSYDGRTVTPYLDLRASGVSVQPRNFERGFQSFAFHPDFNRRGARGFGRFYTYTDVSDTSPAPDFTPGGGKRTHDTVLHEWTAKDPAAAAYDGGPPRELIRFEQPFVNHNGGHITFNPLASPGAADYGLLYVGSADGGAGGDPLAVSQNLASAFGKILRIDPLGSNGANGKYGIPADNPFVSDGKPETLAEIYAYGVRNPQRIFWDSRTGRMYVADIGQNIVEEISPVTAGANLGWHIWEGSFAFAKGTISLENPRSDATVTYPVAEYGHSDPLLQRGAAIAGGAVYRHGAIPQLSGLMIFGDLVSGEMFYVRADALPAGGQDAVRRILFDSGGEPKTLLQVIQETDAKRGRKPSTRADLRFGSGPNGQLFVLNKRDGIIRLFVSGRAGTGSDER